MKEKIIIFSLLITLSLGLNAQILGIVASQATAAPPSGNMISNGDFANGLTDWSVSNAALSVISGELDYSNSPSDVVAIIEQFDSDMNATIVAGTEYILTADVINSTTPFVYIRIENQQGSVEYVAGAYYSDATGISVYFTPTGELGDAGIQLYFWGEDACQLDNIVLVESN